MADRSRCVVLPCPADCLQAENSWNTLEAFRDADADGALAASIPSQIITLREVPYKWRPEVLTEQQRRELTGKTDCPEMPDKNTCIRDVVNDEWGF